MTYKAPPLPTRLRLIQGAGAIAFGVKDSGFSFFLLIFYNQVLGMDASTVGAALGLALVVDALVDPLLGNLSDRTYTRWGRRLPWLYVAPIPLAMVWVVLWHPPGGEAPGFWGLFGICVAVRLLLSACEVPSIALVPELTADYDERTTLFRYRFLSGWLGGLLMMVLAFTVFMNGPNGILTKEGYGPFGIAGAIIMVVSVIGSAAGLHHRVAKLPAVRPPPFSIGTAFQEIREAFSERAFLIFAGGALAAYVSQGLTFSLSQYLNSFVWIFSPLAFQLYPVVLGISALIMFAIVSPLHRRFGKPRTAAVAALMAFGFGFAPYVLLLIGAWPEAGSTASTGFYYLFLIAANTSGIVSMISATSMVAEIVEAFQQRTGRRAEGSFYSGNWLVQKCATGMGIFLSGQIVAIAQLPASAVPGEVERSAIVTLVLLYGAISGLLAAITAFFMVRFPISREDHEARLEALAVAARANPDGTAT